VGAQGQPRAGCHAQAGGDQRLHHDHVVGRVADPGFEPFLGTHRQQVDAAPVAAGDPGGVAQCGQGLPGPGGQHIQRIVEQVMQADAVWFGFGVVVAEDDRDVDLAGAQQFQRLGWLRVGQADLQAGVLVGQRCHRPRDERADHGREAGHAHPPGAQSHVCGQFGVGGIDSPDDLGRPSGQQLTGGGEPDPAPGPLQQLRAGLGLEPGEVVTDRRLRVVQLLRRRGDRSEPRERVDDTQPGDVQHASTLSMRLHEHWHWTYESIGRTLSGMTTAMSLVRVHNFAISLDGFGTGEGQSADAHFGHAGDRLHQWMFATRWWGPGGSGGVDDAFVQQHDPGIGAEIMGAGKWGHPGWHEDPEWKGAWGPNPPFHTPVFVLTHHPRPSIEMEGGTTFHFIDASPAEALEAARKAAGGQDVRLGGGPTMIREFLAAGLIDHMHIVVVPILLGRGVRLWDGLEGVEKDYQVEAISSPSGVTHMTFTRKSA
jgi:dihydrofolate reductase